MSEASRHRLTTGMTTALLTLGLLAAAPGAGPDAQVLGGTLLRSGLHSFPQGHTARLTVAEIGGLRAVARVVIDFRDSRDVLVASTTGVLRRGEPVVLDFPIAEGLTQVRATVGIFTAFAATSTPMVTFEGIGSDSLSVTPKVVCAGPPSGRDSPQALCECPGWEVDSFTP